MCRGKQLAKLAQAGQLPAGGWEFPGGGGRKSEEYLEVLSDAVASTECFDGHNRYLDQRKS